MAEEWTRLAPTRIATPMSSDTSRRPTQADRRIVHCKDYHKTKATEKGGSLRDKHEQKSRCPQWADNPRVRQALLDEALEDPKGAKDMFGHPMKLWNAIDGVIFFGKSCNTMEPRYNCYPEHFQSGGGMYRELEARSKRRLADFLNSLGLR